MDQSSKQMNKDLILPGRLPAQLVVFSLGENRFGIDLWATERIIQSVEITALPGLPSIVSGIIKVNELIIPVFNVRKRFNLPLCEMELTDRIIIATTSKRKVALLVDGIEGVYDTEGNLPVSSAGFLPSLKYVQGVVQLDGGLVLIHNLEDFLSLEEETMLTNALND
jgi:purine-binding chemotaxis protein CheW